jgi:hypothetical protein
MKRFTAAAIGGVLLAGLASAAHAQAGPPIGLWSTADGSEQLSVTQNGLCSLADRYGRPTTSGSCSWNASARGGILTVMSQQTYRPAPIYFNVVWINQTTISVQGDVFYRRG